MCDQLIMAMAKDRLFFRCVVLLVTNFCCVSLADLNLGEIADTVGGLFSAVEDCTHSCENGGTPMRRPGFKSSSNGCGSFGVTVDLESMPGMTQCCNSHDHCYGRCNSDKANCDRELRLCFNEICLLKEAKKENPADVKECQDIMVGSYDLVRSFLGCQAYDDAQGEACQCSTEKSIRGPKRSIYLADVLSEMNSLQQK